MKFYLTVNKQPHSTFIKRNASQAIAYAKLKSKLFGQDAFVALSTDSETIGTYWLGMEVKKTHD